MEPTQALKKRIEEESKSVENKEKPTLLDILHQRNRELQVRKHRALLLRRLGKR